MRPHFAILLDMKVGIDVLINGNCKLLAGQRVGLLSHLAAVGRCGATSAQLLHRELGKNLVALFGPEHGFFGNFGAGERTVGRQHPDWRIPVYALYGDTRKPTPDMLSGIDTMVFDLQDLGVRCYTYLGTLQLLLEACAENNIRMVVTDRPIPLPDVVDGPMLDAPFASFVAPVAVPMVYGMTMGEVATWMVKHLGIDVSLHVVKMRGYRRPGPGFAESGFPDFIPPSPGIRSRETAMTYASTVFSEAIPEIDCGRNTALAFRIFGAPWIHAEEFCRKIADHPLRGVTFSPHRYTAAGGRHDGKELDGVRLTVTDARKFRPVQSSLAIIRTLTDLYGSKPVWGSEGVRTEWFDKLYGTDTVRKQLESGTALSEIIAAWKRFPRVLFY